MIAAPSALLWLDHPAVQDTHTRLDALAQRLAQESLFVLTDAYRQFGGAVQTVMHHFARRIEAQAEPWDRDEARQLSSELLADLRTLWAEFTRDQPGVMAQYLRVGVGTHLEGLETLMATAPVFIRLAMPEAYYTPEPTDSPKDRQRRAYQRWRRRYLGRQERRLRYRDLLAFELRTVYLKNFQAYLRAIGMATYGFSEEISHLLLEGFACLQRMMRGTVAQRAADREALDGLFDRFGEDLDQQGEAFGAYLQEFHQLFAMRLARDLLQPGIRGQIRRLPPDTDKIYTHVQAFPMRWEENQEGFHDYLSTNLDLLSVHIQLLWLHDGITAEMGLRCFEGPLEELQQVRSGLYQLREALGAGEIERGQKVSFNHTENILIFPDDRIVEGVNAHLKYVLETLPETVRMIRKQSREALSQGTRASAERLNISLTETVAFLAETYFVAPLQETFDGLPRTFKQVYHQVQDAIRLISFALSGDKDTTERPARYLEEVLDRVDQQVVAAEARLYGIRADAEARMRHSLQETLSQLSAHRLVEQGEQLRRHIRGERRRQGLRRLSEDLRHRLYDRLDQVRQFWGRTRADVLRANYEAAHRHERNPFALLQDFLEQVSPQAEVLEALPFYYKQLFTGQQTVGRTLLPNREVEWAKAETAVARMRDRQGAGLLVVAEAMAGKTYFCEQVAEHLFAAEMVRLEPPAQGARRSQDLTLAFQQALGRRGSLAQLIESNPPGTVFFFDDLECWWERQAEGLGAIQRLFRCIQTYGQDYHFLTCCNQHAFRLLSRLFEIDAFFADTIHLGPLEPDQLRRALLTRHYSSGMGLTLAGIPEGEISRREKRAFFQKFHKRSHGSIGHALRLWLAQIAHISGDTVHVTEPPAVEMPEIDRADWLILLSQFALHKRLHLDQIDRIFSVEARADLLERVRHLVQAGLLREVHPQQFMINPYAYPYVIRQLQRCQIL